MRNSNPCPVNARPITIDWTSGREHTGGNQTYGFNMMDIPDGVTLDAFEPVYATEAGAFESAYAEVRTQGVVFAPPSVSNIGFGNFTPTGEIELNGTLTEGDQIAVTVGDVAVTVFRVTTETPLAEVATALSAWLNADPEYNQFYGGWPDSRYVHILDKTAHGGTLSVQPSGGVEATATGLTSAMGVLIGRRYA